VAIRNSLSDEVDTQNLSDYQEIAGKGVSVVYKGEKLLAGNDKLMIEYEVEGFKSDESVYTSVYFAADGQYIGRVTLGDEIKAQSRTLVKQLKRVGIKTVTMLTGDKRAIAEKVSEELGLDAVYAELLPQDKVMQMEVLKAQGKIAFVGDGINDAPVLIASDVGFAMGALGSDAAVEAADVVIMNDDPLKVVTAIKIAKKTRRIVLQNIVFALTIKAIVLGLGALGYANMWMAVFADVGVALLALFNAIRIYSEQQKKV
jgi:Cd2+/Zn2+-exporting ATPase